ncbi:hypothetical protein JYU34_021905 [Plutella xylostella]|uniref:Uncharacterized protein n=1 Tax=Plutella xylostella TaxID=51655 RepID=A0ABQ7PRV7_PLUXY|nr:hypothetical protein JYU34_021905 [Plutella xylostella]
MATHSRQPRQYILGRILAVTVRKQTGATATKGETLSIIVLGGLAIVEVFLLQRQKQKVLSALQYWVTHLQILWALCFRWLRCLLGVE